jgi:hypothetical protein
MLLLETHRFFPFAIHLLAWPFGVPPLLPIPDRCLSPSWCNYWCLRGLLYSFSVYLFSFSFGSSSWFIWIYSQDSLAKMQEVLCWTHFWQNVRSVELILKCGLLELQARCCDLLCVNCCILQGAPVSERAIPVAIFETDPGTSLITTSQRQSHTTMGSSQLESGSYALSSKGWNQYNMYKGTCKIHRTRRRRS